MTTQPEAASRVHLAVYDTLADFEFGHATVQLRGAGRQIVTVGPTEEPVVSAGGLRVLPDIPLAELRPEDSSMLILPGADTWRAGALDAFARTAARFVEAGVPIAAICGATYGIATARLLDDRRHTSATREYLAATEYAGGALYEEADAVRAGGVITAGPTEPEAFAREILAELDILTQAGREAFHRVFRHSDPEAYALLMQETAA